MNSSMHGRNRIVEVPRDQFSHLTDDQFQRLQQTSGPDPQALAEDKRLREQPPTGYLSAKQPLHVEFLAQPGQHDTRLSGLVQAFQHHLDYSACDDAYYENRRLIPLVQNWRDGCYLESGMHRKVEYDWHMAYLAREPNQDKAQPAEIEWQLNFYRGHMFPLAVSATLSSTVFTQDSHIQWYIRRLSSSHDAWQPLPAFDMALDAKPVKIDLTPFITAPAEYGFALRAVLQSQNTCAVSWQKTQLFRQSMEQSVSSRGTIEDMGLSICTYLQPDVARHALPALAQQDLPLLNTPRSNGDFTIQLRPTEGSQGTDLEFRAHSAVLGARSGYFRSLLASPMQEAQTHSVALDGISPVQLNQVLHYLYHGEVVDQDTIENYEAWGVLLAIAVRFDIPALVEECEQAIRQELTADTVNAIEQLALDNGATQLQRVCELFVFYHNLNIQEQAVRQQFEMLNRPHTHGPAINFRHGFRRPSPPGQSRLDAA
ncbi:protein modification by small protein conjugation or removal [Dimargaris verticillata]|uniref:Protein modification by small protein conjugation or removal n=1 Tax=Dimargaris verticillata TaxID=2761393 RepID=A0A9W8B3L3_9FUNG|nr:protein modification by small protein conjugation or removal [Dimargaris verticillata]